MLRSHPQPEPDDPYEVVVNDEGQYSIWPTDRERPPGWWPGGATGTREECLEYIEEHWDDPRPESVRQQLEELLEQWDRELNW